MDDNKTASSSGLQFVLITLHPAFISLNILYDESLLVYLASFTHCPGAGNWVGMLLRLLYSCTTLTVSSSGAQINHTPALKTPRMNVPQSSRKASTGPVLLEVLSHHLADSLSPASHSLIVSVALALDAVV